MNVNKETTLRKRYYKAKNKCIFGVLINLFKFLFQ